MQMQTELGAGNHELVEADTSRGGKDPCLPNDQAKGKGGSEAAPVSISTSDTMKDHGAPGKPVSATGSARSYLKVNGTSVSPIITGVVAAILTVGLYLLVIPRIRGTYIGVLLAERGWVQHVITLLTLWAFMILFIKSTKLAQQKRAMNLDLLPVDLPDRIRPDNVNLIRAHVADCAGRHGRNSFLVKRVLQAIEHFRVRPCAEEVAGYLRSESDLALTAMDSSYSFVHVLIWAIPIFGFIGTVLGIGGAVGNFSRAMGDAQELDVIKHSLGGVTSGLAVAFDTTLLGLVMSVLVMIPTNSLHKLEERLLTAVDHYCNEHILRRLDDRDSTGSTDEGVLENAVAKVMATHEELFEKQARRAAQLGSIVAKAAVQGWEAVYRQLQDAAQTQLARLDEVCGVVTRHHQSSIAQLEAKEQAFLLHLTTTVEKVLQSSDRLQEQIVSLQELQRGGAEHLSMACSTIEACFARGGSAAAAALRDAVTNLQTELSSTHDDSAHRLQNIALAVAESAKLIQQEMAVSQHQLASLGERFEAGLTQAIEASSRESRERLDKLVTEVGSSLASLTHTFASGVAREQHALWRSTADQVGALSQLGAKIREAFDNAECVLDRQVAAYGDVVGEHRKVVAAQARLAGGLETLSSSCCLEQRLAGLDEQVERLATATKSLATQVGDIEVRRVPSVGSKGNGRGFWNHLIRGRNHV